MSVVGPAGVLQFDFLLWFSVVYTIGSLSLFFSFLYLDLYLLG